MSWNWVSVSYQSGFSTSSLVCAGYGEDGSKIYVGRALHENKLLPANVIPSKNVCIVSYGYQAHNKFDFEVLSGVGFYWVECFNGDVPEGAVNASDGTGAFYVGRTKHKNSLVIGRISISIEDRCIFVPCDKREFKFPHNHPMSGCYEVLCVPQKAKWYPVTEKMVNPVVVDTLDNVIQYVGQFRYENVLTSAKVFPQHKRAFVSFNGKEVEVEYKDCKILCNGNMKWVYSCHGRILENAVAVEETSPSGETALHDGQSASGEKFYLGRAYFNGSLNLGKIIPRDKVMYFPYHMEEHATAIYEILIEN